MLISTTIPRSKWDKLSPAEQAACRAVGLKPDPRQPTAPKDSPKAKIIKRNPYLLCIINDCRLCGEMEFTYFNMVPSDNGTEYLKSELVQEIGQEIKPSKFEVRRTFSCRNCNFNLHRDKTKSELVLLVITLANAAGKYGTTALLSTEERERILQNQKETLKFLTESLSTEGTKNGTRHNNSVDKRSRRARARAEALLAHRNKG